MDERKTGQMVKPGIKYYKSKIFIDIKVIDIDTEAMF